MFDASALVALHCGTCEDDTLQMAVSDGEYGMYDVKECQEVLAIQVESSQDWHLG